MHRRRTAPAADDAGTTMLELIVVMSIVATLMGIGMFSFSSWQSTSQHQGSAEELVSTLRGAATRAVSEGRTYCVELRSDARSYRLHRTSCTPGNEVDGLRLSQHEAVTYAATVSVTSPPPACPGGSRCLYFHPRGTALPAQVAVASGRRPGKTYTVHVEGLTARVHL